MIDKHTAMDIAMAWREIEAAEQLLAQVKEVVKEHPSAQMKDIRDVFGRGVRGLQLGVPSGDTSQRLFTVSWDLAAPIIEAHIANKKAELKLLNAKAQKEAEEAA